MEQSGQARVERSVVDGQTRLQVSGRLTRDSAPVVLDWFRAWLPKGGRVRLDLGGVQWLDSSGVAVLVESLELAKRRGCRLELVKVSEAARRTLEIFRFHERLAGPPVAEPGELERMGDWLLGQAIGARRLLILMADTFYWALAGPFVSSRGAPRGELTRQAILLGSNAFGIVALLATLIGLTLALLSAHQLRQFGANIYAANLVAVAMTREMGPLMTAIIVAGRSGSAIAAELATMEVTEEIDALRAMGFSPIRFLVVPKLYAVTITQPLLTGVADTAGIFGGMVVTTVALGVPPEAFLTQAGNALALSDVTTGLFKSLIFGWIILVVAAQSGLGTRGGASEVGTSTTRSVVWSIFAVIIADCVFSLIFYL
ncbi:MAG: MlaE family lipid ABC transporter permease subunit [Deltaproteobacteria bacterium]|nr:MlaE family lipid ABC transporter permease subunit [Deltaproteobacteria bacterium]